jgi:hypothetical protein
MPKNIQTSISIILIWLCSPQPFYNNGLPLNQKLKLKLKLKKKKKLNKTMTMLISSEMTMKLLKPLMN